jgi:hypothetical protein
MKTLFFGLLLVSGFTFAQSETDWEQKAIKNALSKVKREIGWIQGWLQSGSPDYGLKNSESFFAELRRDIEYLKKHTNFDLSSLGVTEDFIDDNHGKAAVVTFCKYFGEHKDFLLSLLDDPYPKYYALRNLRENLREFPDEVGERRQQFDTTIEKIRARHGKSKDQLIETWTKQVNACTPTKADYDKFAKQAFAQYQCNIAKPLAGYNLEAEQALAKNQYSEIGEPNVKKSITYETVVFMNQNILAVESYINQQQKLEPDYPKEECVVTTLKTAHDNNLRMFGQKIDALYKNGQASENHLKKVNEDAGGYILYMTQKDFPNDTKAE